MNKKPVSYLQTDSRWKAKRYPCTGGTMSVGGGGCGPTSAAMLIETLTGKTCLPTEAMEWACKHGYVIAEQGTSYDCFRPLFAAYGIDCDMLTWCKCLDSGSWVRYKVIEMLQQGYYFVVLMKKGLWTNGGHYVVLWWSDGKVRINDPASTKDARLNGDHEAFWSTAKYFWWVDARSYNKGEDEEVTAKAIYEALKSDPETAWKIVELANQHAATLEPSAYAKSACQRGIESGLFTDGNNDGLVDNPQSYVKRQELATVLDRKGLLT